MHRLTSIPFAGAVSAAILASAAAPALGQDAIWQHQQHIQAQQAEERRIMEMGASAGGGDGGGGGGGRQDENAARFNYYPPEAWEDFIRHGQKTAAAAEQERRARDPNYRALAEGTWTFDGRVTKEGTRICSATFWTLRGGVSLIHWGGKENVTLLAYFGAAIPNPGTPRIVPLVLTQSGETQRVRGINMHFPPAKGMGVALFTVPSADALVSAIDDKQDFRVEVGGEVVAQGAWHSGRKARAALSACLRKG